MRDAYAKRAGRLLVDGLRELGSARARDARRAPSTCSPTRVAFGADSRTRWPSSILERAHVGVTCPGIDFGAGGRGLAALLLRGVGSSSIAEALERLALGATGAGVSRNVKIRSAEYLTAAAQRRAVSARRAPEVAFLGRSNVGKSSLLNKPGEPEVAGAHQLHAGQDAPRSTGTRVARDAQDDLWSGGPARLRLRQGAAQERAPPVARRSSRAYLEARRDTLRLAVLLQDLRRDVTEDETLLLQWLAERRRRQRGGAHQMRQAQAHAPRRTGEEAEGAARPVRRPRHRDLRRKGVRHPGALERHRSAPLTAAERPSPPWY